MAEEVQSTVSSLSSLTVSFPWTLFSNHTGNVIASRFSSQQMDVSTCGEGSVLIFKSRSEQRIKDYTLHWIWPVGRKVRILIPILHFLCKKRIILPIFLAVDQTSHFALDLAGREKSLKSSAVIDDTSPSV